MWPSAAVLWLIPFVLAGKGGRVATTPPAPNLTEPDRETT
jgi:hypothetical protein